MAWLSLAPCCAQSPGLLPGPSTEQRFLLSSVSPWLVLELPPAHPTWLILPGQGEAFPQAWESSQREAGVGLRS